MQIVVRRSDLANPTPIVLATYDDTVLVDVTGLGLDDQSATVLTVLPASITYQERGPPMLKSDWRNSSASACVNAEAFLRIERVFSSYAQRNNNADISKCITQYGADPATWPADARDRKTMGDQGWTYINSVRSASNAMLGSPPQDPTDDSHWPTEIPKINYPTT